MDDMRDYFYLNNGVMKKTFTKFTECQNAEQADKVVMT